MLASMGCHIELSASFKTLRGINSSRLIVSKGIHWGVIEFELRVLINELK